MKLARHVPSLFSTLALMACGDSIPHELEYDAVARIAGSTVATSHGGGTLGAVRDSLALARGDTPAGFSYEAGMTAGDHGAVHHSYMMIACRDRDNRLLPTCDHQTNLATLIATWSGRVQQPGLEIASHRQGMWTLANLQTWMPTVSGSSQLQSQGAFETGATYELIGSEIETMLATTGIMGGSLQLDLVVTSTRDASTTAQASITAEVIFDSSATATLVLDDARTYRVDLGTGQVELAVR